MKKSPKTTKFVVPKPKPRRMPKGKKRSVVPLYFLPGDTVYEVFAKCSDFGPCISVWQVEAVVIRAPYKGKVEVYYQSGSAWDDCAQYHDKMFQKRNDAQKCVTNLKLSSGGGGS